MSADSTSALGAAGYARPQPLPTPAQGSAASQPVAPVAEKAQPTVALPEKAELTIDPQERQRDLRETIARLNEKMRDNGRALAFSVDEALNRTVITVTNSETGKVIRQIPDEAMLRVAHNIEDVKGLMQDERI